MKKIINFLTLSLVALFLSCSEEETSTCTLKVYRQYNGGKWELIQNASWEGPEQYKNYVKSTKDEEGNITNIKTVVKCD